MSAGRLSRVVVGLSVAATLAGCGKRGAPQPPLRPVPVAVSDLAIERRGAAVTLAFTVPAGNTDGSTPPGVDRVDVYAVSLTVPVDALDPAAITRAGNLVASVYVRPDGTDPADSPGRVAPGEMASVVDAVAGPPAGAAVPIIRRYAVVAAAGRRRAEPAVLDVPLSELPPAPAGLASDVTETALTFRWTSGRAGLRFLVEETDETGAKARRLAGPLAEPVLATPIAFGVRRCVVVRGVDVRGAVSLVGAPAGPHCVTPVDRFPPPAPAGLLALATAEGIEIAWTPVASPDLAGYVVLRGDGPDGTLQRLTPSPVTQNRYLDRAVASGAAYVYAVVAVDAATPANESGPSNRQVITAR